MNLDRAEQLKLAEVLEVSPITLYWDLNKNYCLQGKYGNIYSDGGLTVPDIDKNVYKHGEPFNWYIYVLNRRWSWAKDRFSFMELINDGDIEGRFRLSRFPTKKEKQTIRGVLGLRKKMEYSEERKAYLRSVLERVRMQSATKSS